MWNFIWLGALLIPSLVARLLRPLRREAPWGLSINSLHPISILMSKQYPTRQAMKQSTSGEEGEITIDAGILAAIKVVVREEMGVISARLDNINETLIKLVEVQQRLVEVEEGLQFTSERLSALDYNPWYRGSGRGTRTYNLRQVYSICAGGPQSGGCCHLAPCCLPSVEPEAKCRDHPSFCRPRPAW